MQGRVNVKASTGVTEKDCVDGVDDQWQLGGLVNLKKST